MTPRPPVAINTLGFHGKKTHCLENPPVNTRIPHS